jgi:hypothetical protein
MKAKEIIGTALAAIAVQATGAEYTHTDNLRANIDRILALLDAIPETFNLELEVVVQAHEQEE